MCQHRFQTCSLTLVFNKHIKIKELSTQCDRIALFNYFVKAENGHI